MTTRVEVETVSVPEIKKDAKDVLTPSTSTASDNTLQDVDMKEARNAEQTKSPVTNKKSRGAKKTLKKPCLRQRDKSSLKLCVKIEIS